MILDDYLEFADAVSVVGAAGTYLIGDVVDLGMKNPDGTVKYAQRDIGTGEDLFFDITVDTSIITAGAAGTIQFLLVSDAQAAIAIDGSATVHFASRAYPTGVIGSTDAKLKAGQFPVQIALPSEGPAYEQFVGVLAIIATTAVSAGAINAFFTPDQHMFKPYKSNTGY